MMKVLRDWFDRYLSDEEAVVFLIVLILSFTVILTLGGMLAPVIASVIFAFLMQGVVEELEARRIPHLLAVSIVFTIFMAALLALLLVVMPLAWKQVAAFIGELPRLIQSSQVKLEVFAAQYPELVSQAQISSWFKEAGGEIGKLGQLVVSYSLASLPGLVAVLIYLVLVPMLVFFFLKDSDLLLDWIKGFLPRKRKLMNRIWKEMDDQIANYVRGKVAEILIVGMVTYICLAMLGLKYATLLGVMVGLSVLVPYIGAAVVTVPVALVGFLQWGWTADFAWLMVVYAIIQALDGNVLVPLLFSEVVNLHPVAIIVAVLLFGGLWGFWGVFFAIPLATLFKAVLNAWPAAVEGAASENQIASLSDPA